MAVFSSETDYSVYENRLASFRGPQPVSKRRDSTASSRAPKALTWPHKTLSPSSFAKAGFVFQPTPGSPDNVACFLCDKHLDGWEEDDDPLAEHLKHVPDCGWAIIAAVEAEFEPYRNIHPLDPRMIDARKATFAGKWPYDARKGWKCKTKQMVDGGWYYSPGDESDDMATCAYCQLKLDGWEAADKPIDEHHKRSPQCAFFHMVAEAPAPKRPRATKARASKASRLSMQSIATTMSDLHSAAGDITLDPDVSVMTTTSVATQGGRKGRPRKATTTKTRKTKAKKDEAAEVSEEVQHTETQPLPPPKPTRGRKRGSEEVEESPAVDVERPPPKKRATRGRTSQAVADSVAAEINTAGGDVADVSAISSKPAGRRKDRPSTAKTRTRKVSGTSLKSKASTASLRTQAVQAENVMEIALERQLQEDLDRPPTEDEYMTADSDSEHHKPAPPIKKRTVSAQKTAARHQKQQPDDYSMFDPSPVVDDDSQVEEELRVLEAEINVEKEPQPLVVPKKGKKAGARKVSKQTRKAGEPELSKSAATPAEVAVEGQSESSAVVSRMPSDGAPDPDAVGQDTDSSFATIVDNPTGANTVPSKRGRGRPKKSSSVSHVTAPQNEPAHVDHLAQGNTIDREMEAASSEPAMGASAQGHSVPGAPLTQSSRNTNKSLPPAPPSPPTQSEKPSPATPREHHIGRRASAKQATLSPSQSPQSSDAENQPPSSKPPSTTAAAKRVVLLPPTTPGRGKVSSPSYRNAVGRLRSTHPWEPVDLDLVFALVGDTEAENVLRRHGTELGTPEREMTVEQWIYHNAALAERMLKAECEGMVSKFEIEGGRAMRALEGLEIE